ncbi:hypothetical protein Patl1_01731 [Pistacia atlantica]|uniref:Uncharacterized protein n=1 Tax=Pistacia atlantica TaxID=434234 RepID=A0ACC1CCF9_9ROSI|nr:hypothetical protein Patl1_01731 [Pistacia atlantica]
MGNNVFRYFLEWLKLEIAPKHYVQWLDEHIHAYFAVGSPFLGATEIVKAALSGLTFGLPISEGTARLMSNSFGSTLWMMPFSKHCKGDNTYWKHFSGNTRKGHHTYQCDVQEFQLNYSGWPTNIVNVEIPSVRAGFDAYPSISEIADTNLSSMECGLPTQLSFSAREVSDGTLFKSIQDYDPESKRLLYRLEKSYHGDPVLNPLTPWERPPIKNIFCIYGIDSKTELCGVYQGFIYLFGSEGVTECVLDHRFCDYSLLVVNDSSVFLAMGNQVGYYFAPSGKPYPDNWIITDVIYEIEGSLFSRSGNQVEGNPGRASGDETVPYNSLSWCKSWLGPKVNITRAPQSEHDGSDVQVELNVEHHHDADIVPNMTRSPRVKYITYYEDSESIPGRRTAVWELDKANHRNIVRSPVLMRELWLQMWHDIHPDATSKFVTKAKRGPLRDEDCYWDYAKARCAWPEHCEYRYVFGDVHLGQSWGYFAQDKSYVLYTSLSIVALNDEA